MDRHAWLDQQLPETNPPAARPTASVRSTFRPDRYWARRLNARGQNFKIGHDRMPMAVVHGSASSNSASAPNQSGTRPARLRAAPAAITRAAREVIEGGLDDHFPLLSGRPAPAPRPT